MNQEDRLWGRYYAECAAIEKELLALDAWIRGLKECIRLNRESGHWDQVEIDAGQIELHVQRQSALNARRTVLISLLAGLNGATAQDGYEQEIVEFEDHLNHLRRKSDDPLGNSAW